MSKTQQEYLQELETVKKDPKAKKYWWYPSLLTITNEEFFKYMETFDQIDKDKSGTLEFKELKKAKLLENKIKLPTEIISRLIKAFMLDNDNDSIDRIEFIGMVSFLSDCVKRFEQYDTDHSDSLELSECKEGAFSFIIQGITDLSIEILLELNGVVKKGKDERSLTKIQFVGCCAYLAQCYSIFEKSIHLEKESVEKKKDAIVKFVEMILVIARK